MNRRIGMEGSLGIGGGVISRKSQKNLEKAEDLCRKRKPNKAIPYLLEALKDSPENLDAVIQIAFLMDRPSAVETLEQGEIMGRAALQRRIGKDCFEDSSEQVGHFWDILETRPYMRVLQALVRLYFEEGRFEASAKTMIEMLRLCPGDNMAQRHWLGSVLNRVARYSDALFFAQIWLHPFSHDRGSIPVRGGTAFSEPSRELMSAEREEQLSAHGDGTFLHTAALASFKLWGDCPQSRQYLKAAANANPNVLLKVLGRVSRPENLNNEPRARNGPEEAHDYLWLTQDLWMESDVWNWANENSDVMKAVLKVCSRTECTVTETKVAQFKRCSACHLVSYCGATCQREDWPRHKADCKFHTMLKAASKSVQTGKSLPKDNTIPVYSADFSGGFAVVNGP